MTTSGVLRTEWQTLSTGVQGEWLILPVDGSLQTTSWFQYEEEPVISADCHHRHFCHYPGHSLTFVRSSGEVQVSFSRWATVARGGRGGGLGVLGTDRNTEQGKAEAICHLWCQLGVLLQWGNAVIVVGPRTTLVLQLPASTELLV